MSDLRWWILGERILGKFKVLILEILRFFMPKYLRESMFPMFKERRSEISRDSKSDILRY
jgi:hypothetical protein